MKIEEQNLEIALVCGWRLPKRGERCGDFAIGTGIFTPEGYPYWIKQIPDYVNDLNEMYDAEKVLRGTDEQYYNDVLVNRRWKEYQYFLMSKYGASATATQRSEAFLRILDLWKE